MLLCWNPFTVGRQGAVKDSRERWVANIGRARSRRATRNRRLASRLSGRDVAFVSTAVRGSRHDVKPSDTPRYRTSATAIEWSWRTVGSNQVAGKKNPHPHSGRDSPRHLHPGRIRLLDVPERVPDSDKTARDDGISLAHWPDNGNWRSAAASTGQPPGTPNCNSDPAGAQVGTSAHNLSKDRSGAPNVAGRLALIASVGNAEVGPRGVATPSRSSLVAKR